jgi:hypothetical protein
MSLLHRGCEKAAADQASVIRQLQARCARLEDDLQAADHVVAEIRLACEDLEYGLTDAVIPAHLRDRLAQLQELLQERAVHDQDVPAVA